MLVVASLTAVLAMVRFGLVILCVYAGGFGIGLMSVG